MADPHAQYNKDTSPVMMNGNRHYKVRKVSGGAYHDYYDGQIVFVADPTPAASSAPLTSSNNVIGTPTSAPTHAPAPTPAPQPASNPVILGGGNSGNSSSGGIVVNGLPSNLGGTGPLIFANPQHSPASTGGLVLNPSEPVHNTSGPAQGGPGVIGAGTLPDSSSGGTDNAAAGGDGTGDGSGDSAGDGSGTSDTTGSGSGDTTGTGTGDNSGSGSGNSSGDGSGTSDTTGSGSGDTTGTGTGDNSGSGSGNSSGDGSGTSDTTGSGSGDTTGTGTGDNSGSGSGNSSGDGSGTGDGSGDNTQQPAGVLGSSTSVDSGVINLAPHIQSAATSASSPVTTSADGSTTISAGDATITHGADGSDSIKNGPVSITHDANGSENISNGHVNIARNADGSTNISTGSVNVSTGPNGTYVTNGSVSVGPHGQVSGIGFPSTSSYTLAHHGSGTAGSAAETSEAGGNAASGVTAPETNSVGLSDARRRWGRLNPRNWGAAPGATTNTTGATLPVVANPNGAVVGDFNSRVEAAKKQAEGWASHANLPSDPANGALAVDRRHHPNPLDETKENTTAKS